jgi:hypothetical protein
MHHRVISSAMRSPLVHQSTKLGVERSEVAGRARQITSPGGLGQMAQKHRTELPKRAGVPPTMPGLAEQLHNAAYASSVDILLSGGKNRRQEQSWITKEKGIIDKVIDRVKSAGQLVPWGRH